MSQSFQTLLEIDFELDVSKLFSMSFDFEHLKEALKFLFNTCNRQNQVLKDLVKDNSNLKDQLKAMQEELQNASSGDANQELMKQHQKLKGRVETLQSENQSRKDEISKAKKQISNQNQQINQQEMIIKQHNNSITELTRNDNAQDREIADLRKRIGALEKEVLQLKTISDFKSQIDALRAQLDAKANSTYVNQLKEEIQILREMIGQPTGQTSSSSPKQLHQLKEELLQRIKALEDQMSRILQDLKDYNLKDIFEKLHLLMDKQKSIEKQSQIHTNEIEDLKDKFRNLQQQLNILNETLDAKMNEASEKGEANPALDNALLRNLKMKVDLHDNKIQAIMKTLNDLHNQMKEMGSNKGGGKGDSGDWREQIQALRKELQKLKQDLMNMLLGLENRLNGKADIEALQDLQNRLLEKLQTIFSGLSKKMADKNDTKKAIKMVEKQIKNLYQAMQNRHDHDQDAMFSKKPLGGVSCASCEKDLVNLYGKIAEFQNWNKMPMRDPSERIARIGQGFSRLLSAIRLDQVNKNQKLNSPSSQPNIPPFYDDQQSQQPGSMNNTYSQKMYAQSQHAMPPRHSSSAGRPKTAGKLKSMQQQHQNNMMMMMMNSPNHYQQQQPQQQQPQPREAFGQQQWIGGGQQQ